MEKRKLLAVLVLVGLIIVTIASIAIDWALFYFLLVFWILGIAEIVFGWVLTYDYARHIPKRFFSKDDPRKYGWKKEVKRYKNVFGNYMKDVWYTKDPDLYLSYVEREQEGIWELRMYKKWEYTCLSSSSILEEATLKRFEEIIEQEQKK